MLLTLVLPSLVGCIEDGTIDAKFATYLHDDTSENIAALRRDAEVVDCAYDPYEGGTGFGYVFDNGVYSLVDSDPVDKDLLFGDSCYQERAAAEAKFTEDNALTPVDCRVLVGEGYSPEQYRDDRLYNVDYEASCCLEALDSDSGNDPDGDPFTFADCTPADPRYFTWLDDYAYYLSTGSAKTDDGATYRVEAVLTSEHDLQLTVHTETAFGDFRFGWVIDPHFAPTVCEDDGNGGAVEVAVDGADWVDSWSANDPGYKVYHLTGGSYQINPSNTGDAWYFDISWQAGYCFARLGEEEFYCHSTDYQDMATNLSYPYGHPLFYSTYGQLYGMGYDSNKDDPNTWAAYTDIPNHMAHLIPVGGYFDLDCGGGDDCYSFSDYEDLRGAIVDTIETGGVAKYAVYASGAGGEAYEEYEVEIPAANSELAWIGGLSADALSPQLLVEENGWRDEQSSGAGLGGWGGVSPSWVKFKDNVDLSAVEAGKQDSPIEGEFQIYLDAVASASKLIVKGSFSIDNVREDALAVDPLEEIKREENNTPSCGE